MAQLCNFQQDFLSPTYFCNHGNSEIKPFAQKLEHETQTPTDYVKNVFYFIRDIIRFGINLWQKKASETLSKGYGACYNKNLLMIAFQTFFKPLDLNWSIQLKGTCSPCAFTNGRSLSTRHARFASIVSDLGISPRNYP